MDARQAEHLFQEADVLFRQGQYAQALQRLDYLAEQYPNESKILYPRALALTQVGRHSEALELCERLIHQHHFEKAQELKDHIRTEQLSQQKPPPSKSFRTPPEIPMAGAPAMPQVNIDELLNQPPAYARPAAPAKAPRRASGSGGLSWPLLILLSACGMFVAGAVAGLISASTVGAAGVAPGRLMGLTGSIFSVWFLSNVAITWLALRILNQLSGDIDEDMKNIAIVVGVSLAVSAVPFVGSLVASVAFLYLLSRYFELSCGSLVLFALISFALNAAVMLIVFLFFGTAILGLLGLGSMTGG